MKTIRMPDDHKKCSWAFQNSFAEIKQMKDGGEHFHQLTDQSVIKDTRTNTVKSWHLPHTLCLLLVITLCPFSSHYGALPDWVTALNHQLSLSWRFRPTHCWWKWSGCCFFISQTSLGGGYVRNPIPDTMDLGHLGWWIFMGTPENLPLSLLVLSGTFCPISPQFATNIVLTS